MSKYCGFGTRIGQRQKRNSTNSHIDWYYYMKFECYKFGVKKESVKDNVKTRETVKTDCKCFIRFRWNVDETKYKIVEWKDAHNHPMVEPNKRQFLVKNKVINPIQEKVITLLIDAGNSQRSAFEYLVSSHGGLENVGFLRVDLKNMLNKKRQINMLPGEATVLLRWFKDQALTRTGFFYDMQVDENGQISSIFWGDPTMISDYALFGDFLSFDVTYRTNKAYRPLGIFCGFNHHKGTCVFGGALLYDETGETFEWLFDAFLRCMKYKYPITFMTDQAAAIGSAARKVFPEVFHALCSWHIQANGEKNLGSLATKPFFDEFKHVVQDVDDEQQFEYSWNKMIIDFFPDRTVLQTTWLERTYAVRKQWSSALVRAYFTAGKSTTQLSEQLNACSRFYLKPDMSLSNFFIRFQKMVDSLRHNELRADHNMLNRVAPNRYKNEPIVCHAAEVYTPAIFNIFQDQYERGRLFDMEFQPRRVSSQSITVWRREIRGDPKSELLKDHIVEVDMATFVLSCSCRFYNNLWVFCCHILRVMDALAILGNPYFLKIPAQYIKCRWTGDCKKDSDSNASFSSVVSSNDSYVGRYQQMCSSS